MRFYRPIRPNDGNPVARIPNLRKLQMLLAVTFLFGWGGCSKEELNQAIESATEKTKQVANEATKTAKKTVKNVLPESGSIEFSGAASGKTDFADVRVIGIPAEVSGASGMGGPSVIQIKTYRDDSAAAGYPRILIQATGQVSNLATAVGKRFDCDVYLQLDYQQLAMTPEGEMASLQISGFDPKEKVLKATVAPFKAVTPDNKEVSFGQMTIVAAQKEINP